MSSVCATDQESVGKLSLIRVIAAVITLVPLGCISVSRLESKRLPAAESSDSQAFGQLIEKAKADGGTVKTIEAFIQNIPKGMRDDYVIGFESRSIQEATENSPRVILKSSDGKAWAAFNGGLSKQLGGETIEAVRYNNATESNDFFEVQFQGGRAQVLGPNPAKCLQCHGTRPILIWDDYFTWSGFIGGADDYFFLEYFSSGNTESEREKDLKFRRLFPKDYPLFRRFQEIRQVHPRFKYLGERPRAASGEHPNRPNDAVMKAAFEINGRILAAELVRRLREVGFLHTFLRDFSCLAEASPHWAREKKCLEKTSQALGLDLMGESVAIARKLTDESREANAAKLRRHVALHGQQPGDRKPAEDRLRPNPDYEFLTGEDSFLAYAYLQTIAELFGLDLPSMSGDFLPENFGVNSGGGSGGYYWKILSPAMSFAGLSPHGYSIIRYEGREADEASGEELRQSERLQSVIRVRAVGKSEREFMAAREQERRMFVKSCSRCHVHQDHTDIPPLEFHDAKVFYNYLMKDRRMLLKMKSRLTPPLGTQGAMPPSGYIDERTRKALVRILDRYLETHR